jgi:general stress protein 26
MTETELQRRLEDIVSVAKAAVYATNVSGKPPQLRWVTPAFLRDHPGAIYFVTFPGSRKVKQTRADSSVSWSFQTPSLDCIVQVHGTAVVLENAALASEVLEQVGPRLSVFWRVTPDQHRLTVIETTIESAEIFHPMKGSYEAWSREGGSGGRKAK